MCIKDILEEREKTKQKTSEETTTDNPPNLMMNIKEAQQTPKRINSKRFYS